jgi:hypothetical protein
MANTLLKLVPVIFNKAPAPALVGAKEVIVGAGIKVNPANEAVPPGVVRLTAPVAPSPTIARREVEETTVNDVTGIPPNVIANALLKLVPVILMSAPAAAVFGANEVMVGAGIKVKPAKEAVPPGVVKLTAPPEPVPTIATMEVEETTVNAATGVPPNVMADVLLKLVPVILINAPAAAVVGANEVIVGAGINVKPANEAVPPGVVKLTAPVEPELTRATMEVEETTVNAATGVPPNVRTNVLSKLVPVILINAPAAAVLGANAVIVGAGIKVKPAKEAVPPGVVRLTAPVAPIPTIARMEVEEITVNDVTGIPPNVMADVLLKLVPVIVISAPAAAVIGANAVIVGGRIKVKPAKEAVPPGVVKLTAPDEPAPTIATIDVEDTTVNARTGVPPNVMIEVPLKLVPVIVIIIPLPAAKGEKLVMVGAGIKINPAKEAVPPGVVKLTAPEDPIPTIATIEVDEMTVKELTDVPPNVKANVPSKFVPVILINAPAAAVVGAKEVMVGGGIYVKPAREAVPPGVVKLTAPVEPLPTVATIVVDDTTVNDLTLIPPSDTANVLSK